MAGVSESDATTIAKKYMQDSSFTSDSVTLDVDTEASTVGDFDRISCTVTIDFDDVSVIGDPFSIGASEVKGQQRNAGPELTPVAGNPSRRKLPTGPIKGRHSCLI